MARLEVGRLPLSRCTRMRRRRKSSIVITRTKAYRPIQLKSLCTAEAIRFEFQNIDMRIFCLLRFVPLLFSYIMLPRLADRQDHRCQDAARAQKKVEATSKSKMQFGLGQEKRAKSKARKAQRMQ